jgi:hypothetical protein
MAGALIGRQGVACRKRIEARCVGPANLFLIRILPSLIDGLEVR